MSSSAGQHGTLDRPTNKLLGQHHYHAVHTAARDWRSCSALLVSIWVGDLLVHHRKIWGAGKNERSAGRELAGVPYTHRSTLRQTSHTIGDWVGIW